jgi:hypothetical protein
MRKKMELIAKYNTGAGKMSAREKFLSRGVYPLLKNIKYGALAAGAGMGLYGLSKLLNGDNNAISS